jgi:predicted NBD/HSP70 family sugar kinase
VEPLCLAVDIGGTKMAAGLVDREGEIRDDDHVALNSGASTSDNGNAVQNSPAQP